MRSVLAACAVDRSAVVCFAVAVVCTAAVGVSAATAAADGMVAVGWVGQAELPSAAARRAFSRDCRIAYRMSMCHSVWRRNSHNNLP